MRGAYNKEALNRIAAQDKLDKMIVLVSPVAWISIIGAFLIILGLLLWGFFGKLPSTVETSGIYILDSRKRDDEISSLIARNH